MTAKRVLLAGLLLQISIWAQAPTDPTDQPDAQRTRAQLFSLMNRYPPALRSVLALDPSLLTNQPYLAPYPALASFLTAHPDVVRNPSFYIGDFNDRRGSPAQDRATYAAETWRSVLNGISIFLGFGMAISVIVWLIRTILDYRRWNRLARVQSEVHTRILDRFTDNAELMAYIQTDAGKRFLESSPIMLDAGPRSIGAPLGRILWSVQAGLVLAAAGIGLDLVSAKFADDTSQPLQVFGVLGIALGIGFVISATISFLISRKLGLIDPVLQPARSEPPHVS